MILEAAYISVKVVIISVIITFIISLLGIRVIGNKDSRWKKFLETLIILPMFMPPSAIGYLILIVCGRNGFIGKLANEYLNISIIFTIGAAVIASTIVTLPIMYQSIRVAVLGVDKEIKEAARLCGASEFQVFTKIILPLSKRGIFTGLLLSFARAFGEFGATILVAGNIPGKTQTLPMAMYYAIENNNNKEAINILIIIFVLAVFLISIYSYLINKED
ncbi:molybdate ABC transporter permease subunit [Clostridium sp.]|uniref:molybdate ABC transporter permease subunit n=1 Tax=Clostridium sp. TaxID=1506 RepID=UPI003F3C829C